MTDFASIAERIAEYPIGSAPDPHTRGDAINALREAAQVSAQRDALVVALETALPGLQDLVNQQCADESVYERDLSTLRMAKTALARAKGDQSLDLDEDGYPTGLPHCNPMGCT